jgi:hypothetical protein
VFAVQYNLHLVYCGCTSLLWFRGLRLNVPC